ncbi:hypothetical protein DSECCO2_571230 [anaerobic digester metagenome]
MGFEIARLSPELFGNLRNNGFGFVECIKFAIHQVDDSLEFIFLTNRNLKGDGPGVEVVVHLFDNIVVIGSGSVNLVYKRDSGDFITLCLVPYGFTLGLHTAYSAEQGNHAVDYTQGTFHLNGKINVTGSVNNIDLRSVP